MRHLASLLALVALPAFAAAKGFVESASPPVAAVGKTTRVAFVGKDLGPGLGVWAALPKGAISAKPVGSEPGKLVFDLTVAADAPVGVCGLRLATRDGLTNAVLFHLEDLPAKDHSPSDTPMSLGLPACVWGTFTEGAADRYAITAAAGERVSFEAVANRLGKDADPLLTIRDSSGAFVAERDNDPGLYFDFRFEHTFAKAGTYTLELRDARLKASEHNHYIFRAGRFPTERVAAVPAQTGEPRGSLSFATVKRPGDQGSAWVPISAAEGAVTVARDFDDARDAGFVDATSPAAQLAFLLTPTRANPFQPLARGVSLGKLQATPASVPGSFCGVLRKPGRPVAFAVQLGKGERIFVRAESKVLNSPADLEISVTDRFGREQRRAADGPTGAEATLDFTAPATGEYGIVVKEVLRDGSDSHAFCLRVRHDPFPPALTAEVEGLTVPQGSYQTLPILVTRTGTAGPIALSLAGNPPGLTLTPNQIPATANSVVCKLEADRGVPLGIHTVQIVAEYEKAPELRRTPGGSFYAIKKMVAERERVLVRTRPLIDKKYHNVDLIPIALREDQTRLPPALTDRFAVQVTPPSPFTFELPDGTVTLSRYLTAPIPVVTTRVADFDGPISFRPVGGQLGDKAEGRTRVYAEFPDATAKQPNVSGVVVSKILTNTAKARIDVTATGTHKGRRVSLTRTFDLDIVTAFQFASEPVKVALLPGESATVKLTLSRLKAFDAPVKLHLSPTQGIEFPEHLTVPKGETTVEFTVKATADAQPRKQNLTVHATGEVGGFEEDVRANPVEVEVKKVEPPKKK